MSNTTPPPNGGVTAANPLTISGIYRRFGTVRIDPGGRIFLRRDWRGAAGAGCEGPDAWPEAVS